MKTLLHPTYFPNIATFAVIMQNDVCWEIQDNYQKQTYRNRNYICTDIGKHLLSIPIQHIGSSQGHQKYKDVKLENSYKWQRQHWRTLQTAYRSSPFFEFYEDAISVLYLKEYSFLLDFNLKTIETICDCLQLKMPTDKTIKYEPKLSQMNDGRFLASTKKEISLHQKKYVQVFDDRHRFVENTSILDLLFNEGTNVPTYLQQHNLSFLDA
ncbi:MAG: WbqC family protein [Flavobacteriaceae bacterium]